MSFPDPGSIHLSLAFGADLDDPSPTFTEVTAPDMDDDWSSGPVVVEQGYVGNSSTSSTRIDFGLRNDGGQFSRRNPLSPYYGQIRDNTPVKVEVDVPFVGLRTIAYAYVPEFSVSWDGPGINERLALTAQGKLAQLDGGDAISAARRSFMSATSDVSTGLVAYWPLEDEAGSVSASSPMSGVDAGLAPVNARAEFGQQGPAGSAGAVRLVCGDAIVGPFSDNRPALSFTIPSHTAGEFVWSMWFKGAPFGETSGANNSDGSMASAECVLNFKSGTIGSVRLLMVETVPGTSDRVSYVAAIPNTAINASGTDLTEINTVGGPRIFDGAWHQVQIRLSQSGPDVATQIYIDGSGLDSATEAGQTLGIASGINLATSGAVTNGDTSTDVGGFTFYASTLAVHNSTTPTNDDLYACGAGYPGEGAFARASRLTTEAGESLVYFDTAAPADNPMGPQPAKSLTDLLQECADAAEGFLFDGADVGSVAGPSLCIVGRGQLYGFATSETPLASLTHGTEAAPGMLAALQPDDSNRDAVNIATVRLPDGSTATAEVTTGPRGSSRATGIGPRPYTYDRNLATMEQAQAHANWLAHLGTVDRPRYYASIDLAEYPDFVFAWTQMLVGSRVDIPDPPSTMVGPEPASLMVVGRRDTLDVDRWTAEMWLEPYDGYNVFEIGAGRIASSSVLASSYSDSDVSLSVTSDSDERRWVDSATYPDAFPIIITIAGERMTCTDIAGTSATQTFTVTRGLDGVVKPLPADSPVQIWSPAAIAL